MSQKKSYMNKENILSEGFFDKLKKGLSKLLKVAGDSREAKKAWKEAEVAGKEYEDSLRKYAKSVGLDYDKEMDKRMKRIMK